MLLGTTYKRRWKNDAKDQNEGNETAGIGEKMVPRGEFFTNLVADGYEVPMPLFDEVLQKFVPSETYEVELPSFYNLWRINPG